MITQDLSLVTLVKRMAMMLNIRPKVSKQIRPRFQSAPYETVRLGSAPSAILTAILRYHQSVKVAFLYIITVIRRTGTP